MRPNLAAEKQITMLGIAVILWHGHKSPPQALHGLVLFRCMICFGGFVLHSLRRWCKSGCSGCLILERGARVVGLEEAQVNHTEIKICL